MENDRKDYFLGHPGACYDPGSSRTECQVQGSVAALCLVAGEWVGCSDLSAQATGVYSTGNCLVFDKDSGKSMEASRILGFLGGASKSSDWGPGPAVRVIRAGGLHITELLGTAADAGGDRG